MKLGEILVQLHQVSSKSDEKQKSFINSPFFCSEFQSVSRIVKIVHSAKEPAEELKRFFKKSTFCKHTLPTL